MHGKMYERFLQDDKSKLKVSSKELREVLELIEDLGWDYDRMSSSGQETYHQLCLKLGILDDEDFPNEEGKE